MNWNQVWTVYGKELRDSLRDRRTLISTIVFPAVIMPALMFGFGFMSFKVVKSAQAEIPSVMILGHEKADTLRQAFEKSSRLKMVPPSDDYAQQISDKKLRAAVEIPDGFEAALEKGALSKVKIYTYSGEMKSGFAADEVDRVLRDYRETLVKDKLTARGLPGTFIRPFDIERQNVAPPEKVGGNVIGGVIPYLLIFLSFVGAMYPAIDLTAGEKERGTMETILCSPVGRMELVLGKFFTVLTASLFTVAISVISLGLSAFGVALTFANKTAEAAKAGAKVVGEVMPTISPLGVAGVLVMIIPLAILFAAIVFTTALFAKSHKEAQTYVSPFMLVIILPAVAAMLPGVELNAKLALIPILNVSLVSKEMVSGSFPLGLMALIFVSSCLYAAGALVAAVKMFNRESVLFRA